jgi:hypothetical protein
MSWNRQRHERRAIDAPEHPHLGYRLMADPGAAILARGSSAKGYEIKYQQFLGRSVFTKCGGRTVPAAMLFFHVCHENLSESIGYIRSITEGLNLTSI